METLMKNLPPEVRRMVEEWMPLIVLGGITASVVLLLWALVVSHKADKAQFLQDCADAGYVEFDCNLKWRTLQAQRDVHTTYVVGK